MTKVVKNIYSVILGDVMYLQNNVIFMTSQNAAKFRKDVK